MQYKQEILEILRDNQPMSISKFDRLFYADVPKEISWLETVEELEKQGLITQQPFCLTIKGGRELDSLDGTADKEERERKRIQHKRCGQSR